MLNLVKLSVKPKGLYKLFFFNSVRHKPSPCPSLIFDKQNSYGPDSVMVRAFASEAGGAGSNPGRVIPKTLKMVPVATLLGAQH